MKKGPLTKQDKNYIKKYAGKITVDAIAHHLDRGFKSVEKVVNEVLIEKAQKEVEKDASPIEEPVPERITALDMMGRNKRYGAVTMTEAASMAADESIRNRKQHFSSRYKDCILIMNKDRDK
jgi:hypothetical protein